MNSLIPIICLCISAPPIINYYSPAIVTFEGNDVELVCSATNDADAINLVQVSWYYRSMLIKPDGENVVINNTRDNATDEIRSVLSFNSINSTDDGVYTCRAYNNPQSFTENQIKVTVECELIIHS